MKRFATKTACTATIVSIGHDRSALSLKDRNREFTLYCSTHYQVACNDEWRRRLDLMSLIDVSFRLSVCIVDV